MGQTPSDWDPDVYPSLIRNEIEDYDLLQEKVLEASRGRRVDSILELGTGEGETARRLLAEYPEARLHGIDSSEAMLSGARKRLPMGRVELTQQDLSEELPAGPFDLVITALAVHHLEGRDKAVLFERVASVLADEGRFVLGDVVVPEDPADAVIDNQPGYDFPSRVDEQLEWLEEAGFRAEVLWQGRDLAVITADVARRPPSAPA